MQLRDKMNAVIANLNEVTAEREELIELIAIALLTKKNLFILGGTGQGKSYAVNQFRMRIKDSRQFVQLLSKQTVDEQLFGRIQLSSLIPGNVDPAVLEQDETYHQLYSKLIEAVEEYRKTPKSQDSERSVALEELKSCRERLEEYCAALYTLHGNRPRINTADKIPDSDIVFLDEIYKANDSVLNSLLMALNERVYTNEGQTCDIPTISFFSASNEIPNLSDPAEKILIPLYDRFELKFVTQYIESRDTRLDMLRKLQKSPGGITLTAQITLDELISMQDEVRAVRIPEEINEIVDDVMCCLRSEGIEVSDRKYFNFSPIVQAKTWLSGRDAVVPNDLMILRHYFWTTPDQREKVTQILGNLCINPLKTSLENLTAMASEIEREFIADNSNDNVKPLFKLRNEIVSIYKEALAKNEDAVTDNDKENLKTCLASLVSILRSAYDRTCFTFTSMEQLIAEVDAA